MARIQIDDSDRGSILVCPVCGENCLHHGTVGVYDRDTEDGDGTLIKVAKSVSMKRIKSDDIPGRRSLVDIHFACEIGCSAVLRIMQHKGATYLKWVQTKAATIEPDEFDA